MRAIVPQPNQASITAFVEEHGAHNWLTPDSWTAFAGTEVVAVGGIMPIWVGRGYAWSILSQSAGLHFLRLHRVVRTLLDGSSNRRIEAHVDVDFEAGHRWIEMLGFRFEARLTGYNPDGSDAIQYVRIR